jgi:FG-GAP repeat protein
MGSVAGGDPLEMPARFLILALALCALAFGPASAEATSRVAGDFDGDGFDDLAVGVPLEGLFSAEAAGAVNVIYGSTSRLTAEGNQLWHQGSDRAEAVDLFGFSLAAGDFNGDGYDDLAVGVPLEDVGSISNAGEVNVIYGSADGLFALEGIQFWHQDSSGIADEAEADDRFGESLTAGDFNGDGHDDLAVGVPKENVGSILNAGEVNVIYGSGVGLTADGNQLWHQDSSGIADPAEAGDSFGSSLTAGDFNGSGHDDLAVGVPLENVGSSQYAGAVNVLYGSGVGLRANGNRLWHQNSTGIADAAEAFDRFGSSLAAGDLNSSGHDDLAVGVPLENVGSIKDAGAVNVLYGAGVGLRANGNRFRHQDSTGIADAAEAGDRFGSSLTAGDFNPPGGGASGFDDLAVGARGEDLDSLDDAGAVNAIYGSAGGLTAERNRLWHQDSTGIADAAEEFDEFGFSLTAGDFTGRGPDDLAVGVQHEGVGSAGSAGAVNVIYGSGVGLRATGNQFWHQDSTGIADAAEPGDLFGASLPT